MDSEKNSQKPLYPEIKGLTCEEAEKYLKTFIIRPVVIDGNKILGTCDVKYNRINVELRGGYIYRVLSIG